MAWQVVWALGLAFADEPVAGVAIRTPNQWQMAAYVIAVVASIALANAFPTRRLARETRIAAIVGLALGYALMLATGFADGWEAAPVAVTGLATVAGIDSSPPALPNGRLPALAWRSRSSSPSPWRLWFPTSSSAGRESRRRSRRSRCSSDGRAGDPARWSEQSPSGSRRRARVGGDRAVGSGSRVRHRIGLGPRSPDRRVSQLHAPARGARTEVEEITWLDAAAALLPVGIAYGLWQELGPETALVVSAALLAAWALAYMLVGFDRVASYWLAVSATCLGVLTVGPWEREGASASLILSAGLCSAVVAVAALSAVTRVWLGAAGVAWTAFLGMELAGLALEQRALVWAGAGLLVVLVAAAAARSEVRLHFIAVGQLATAGALGSVVSSAGGVRLACIGAWTLGWVVEIAAGEVRGRSENAFGRAFAVLGPLLVVLSLPVLVLEAARFAGLLEGRPGLPGVLLAVLALLEAFIARAIERRRPLAELVVAGAFGTSSRRSAHPESSRGRRSPHAPG